MITAIELGKGTAGVASGPPGKPPKVSRRPMRDGRLVSLSRSPLAILLHAWRLRRVRRAFATLNRRLAAYELAYGTGAIRLTDEDLRTTGLSRTAD